MSEALLKRINIEGRVISFVDIILETLPETLVIFCEFYLTFLKCNSGFISKLAF
jgi:hypothetical protein